MRAVDAYLPVRPIARDDSRQAASAEIFIEKGAWVPVLAMGEAAWVPATVYELSSSGLAKAIEMLLHHRDLVLQDGEAVSGALKLFRARPGPGFSDCRMRRRQLRA